MPERKPYTIVEISPMCFAEVKRKMEEQGLAEEHFYLSASGVPAIDMHGLMLAEADVSITEAENNILADAIDRMGAKEIDAFREEIDRGQQVPESPANFWHRALKALFGVRPSPPSVEDYQGAARRMVEEASKR